MSISWFMPWKMARRRWGMGWPAGVVSVPNWISRRLLLSASITP